MRGANRATQVLEELQVRHPTEAPIESLAMLRGALVRDTDLKGAQGRLTRVGNRAIISVGTSVTYEPRRRFVIAHELGHLELHKERHNQIEACEAEKIREVYDQGTEREANSFASEFLMPRRLWNPRVDVARPNLDLIRSLADDYQVSFLAAAIRFVKLCPERCCVVFAKDGKVEWWAASLDFGYRPERGSTLDPYTLAYDYFHKGTAGEQQEQVSATAWLEHHRLNDSHDLFEHCRVMPSMGATLSLLWIPADADF